MADLAAWRAKLEPTKQGRGAAVKALASAAHCTAAHVRNLIDCASAYGVETRYPDVSQALFLECIRAGRRLARKPSDVLDEALREGWHVAVVRQLGRASTLAPKVLDATCAACGAEVRVKLARVGGSAMPCPECVRRAWENGGDGREAYRLGVPA
jgi:hypothetical protein